MKRYALLTDANTFPLLGAGATLHGCNNDSRDLISQIMQGPWKKSGYDKAYWLGGPQEHLNEAPRVRECLDEFVRIAVSGDTIILPNSSHGSHGIDRLTGKKVSITVAHGSTWDDWKSFISKLDYQRAFEKLKPGVNVWCFFDSCESGNIGQAFKLLERPDRTNRWFEPPMDIQRDLDALPFEISPKAPQQVCTMAGCTEFGTCADVGGAHPHGLFSDTRNRWLLSNPKLSWYELARSINSQWTKDGEEQRCVVDGPDRAFDLA